MNETPAHEPHVRFERRDISVRHVAYFAGIAIVLAILMHGALGVLTSTLFSAGGNAASPVTSDANLAPTPRLQINETADLAEVQRQAALRLNSYGWINRQDQRTHIPIDKAMESIVQNGLPKWSETKAKKAEAPQ